jgi:lipoprotein-releasing system permease protein
LNFEFFVAKRIFFNKTKGKNISKPIVKIAQAGIILGISIMLISISIAIGFKNEIKKKTIGFGSHIQIINFDTNNSFETIPIVKNEELAQKISKIPGVKHTQVFSTKTAVFKTKDNVNGIILKGIDKDINWDFFKQNIIEGNTFKISDKETSKNILISKKTADLLDLKVNDTILTYFIQKPIRFRKFKISGIYETGMVELDKMFAIVDIKQIQKLNKWGENQISGYEVNIDDFDKLELITQNIQDIIGYDYTKQGGLLKIETIKEKFSMLFDWISLFDTNVWVILILITLVAGFNMVSGLLVIILENTRMIGVFKAMGGKNSSIRKIFLIYSAMIIGRGVLWGNLLGLAFIFIQQTFGIFTLDPESYYVSIVPTYFVPLYFLYLNIGVIIITILMLIIPSYIVSKITPVKAIKFN